MHVDIYQWGVDGVDELMNSSMVDALEVFFLVMTSFFNSALLSYFLSPLNKKDELDLGPWVCVFFFSFSPTMKDKTFSAMDKHTLYLQKKKKKRGAFHFTESKILYHSNYCKAHALPEIRDP